jgi:predicted TIM-barrel fold metal-dependent hydrolase
MSEWTSRRTGITDGHVHMGSMDQEEALLAIAQATCIERMALVSIQNAATGEGLPQSLYMKHRHPGRFFVFAGLNHAERLTDGKVRIASLADQASAFAAMGCDGIKMIEGKPTARQQMDVPVTDPYFAEYWARVEELGTPIVWHVNDPEEFWDADLMPQWARKQGWGYGPGDVQKEALYTEVDEVLARHPRLRIAFAHFYFLSADLPRAARCLDEHPTVCFDLAPGVEMLYNISRDPEAGREFFTRYSDRILFGTDLMSGLSIPQAEVRAGIVFRWLESEDEFRMPPEADFLLGPPEDGLARGMSLPDDVLSRIYGGNLARLAGAEPRPLDTDLAAEECERLAAIAEAMSGTPAAETSAARVAAML